MREKRPRLKDVARVAGVSVSAASMALSKDARISASTRRRVERAAEELGYRRRSRDGGEPMIGVIFTDSPESQISSFYHRAFEGIIEEAMIANARLLVSRYDSQSDPAKCHRWLEEAGADGFIVLGGHAEPLLLRHLLQEDARFLCIGKRTLPDAQLSWVSSDYLRGSQEAVDHLIALGHNRIALVVNENHQADWYVERILGYQTALARHGLEPGPRWIVRNIEETAVLLADDGWKRSGVTAAFAINFFCASSLLAACGIADVSVPGDLAVVGFDDPAEAATLYPPLTAVRQPLHELGAVAVRTLLAWTQGSRHQLIQSRLATSLVIRDSCGAHKDELTPNSHSIVGS